MDWTSIRNEANAEIISVFGVLHTFSGGVEAMARFEDEYALGNVGQTGMASSQPSLLMLDSDVPPGVIGQTVPAGGDTYRVATMEPNGVGMTRLLLVKP